MFWMVYRVLADTVACVHLAFVLFVAVGAVLAARWRGVAWVHLPAAAWGAFVEFTGWICPLTPLENALDARAGEVGYAGGFVDHYLMPLIYPATLTRGTQVVLGLLVVVFNGVVYAWLILSRRSGGRGRIAPPGSGG